VMFVMRATITAGLISAGKKDLLDAKWQMDERHSAPQTIEEPPEDDGLSITVAAFIFGAAFF
jgi:hypothetical protein